MWPAPIRLPREERKPHFLNPSKAPARGALPSRLALGAMGEPPAGKAAWGRGQSGVRHPTHPKPTPGLPLPLPTRCRAQGGA